VPPVAWLACLACSGCALQQTTTTYASVHDAVLVAVHTRHADGSSSEVLASSAEARTIPLLPTTTATKYFHERPSEDEALPLSVELGRATDTSIAVRWPRETHAILTVRGAIVPTSPNQIGLPNLHESEMRIPISDDFVSGHCAFVRGRRGGGGWSCLTGTLDVELRTPWSNVASVYQHVDPIAHGWGVLDLVLGTPLTLLGATYLAPPHDRRSPSSDREIGVILLVPGVLALLNGVAILLRSPHDTLVVGRYDPDR
jgi:hypothetical protein